MIEAWIQAPRPIASAARNRFCSSRSASIWVRIEPMAPSGTLMSLLRKPFFTHLLHAGRAVEIAVVDDGRPRAVGLRQEVHHAVDVLLATGRRRETGSWCPAGSTGSGWNRDRPGNRACPPARPAGGRGCCTLACSARAISRLGAEARSAVGRRRQLAQEIGAAVVDQEEMRALRVVGAAGGAAGHVEVGLRHDRRARRADPRTAGPAWSGRCSRSSRSGPPPRAPTAARGGLLRLVAHAARQHRAAPADAMRAAPPDRLDQRPCRAARRGRHVPVDGGLRS